MKLVFNTENKTVELQNENNEVVDFWKAETEKSFFFSTFPVIMPLSLHLLPLINYVPYNVGYT